MCEQNDGRIEIEDEAQYLTMKGGYVPLDASKMLSVTDDTIPMGSIPVLVAPGLPYPEKEDEHVGHMIRVRMLKGASMVDSDLLFDLLHTDEKETCYRFRLPLGHDTLIFLTSILTVGKWGIVGEGETEEDAPLVKHLPVTADLVDGASIMAMNYRVIAEMGLLDMITEGEGEEMTRRIVIKPPLSSDILGDGFSMKRS